MRFRNVFQRPNPPTQDQLGVGEVLVSQEDFHALTLDGHDRIVPVQHLFECRVSNLLALRRDSVRFVLNSGLTLPLYFSVGSRGSEVRDPNDGVVFCIDPLIAQQLEGLVIENTAPARLHVSSFVVRSSGYAMDDLVNLATQFMVEKQDSEPKTN
jgi:hypothetical protein